MIPLLLPLAKVTMMKEAGLAHHHAQTHLSFFSYGTFHHRFPADFTATQSEKRFADPARCVPSPTDNNDEMVGTQSNAYRT